MSKRTRDGIDSRGAVLRCARSPGADQLAERRFVAQDEIGERRPAPALDVALGAHAQIEVAALEPPIEIDEAEKRAGVGCREPRFSAVAVALTAPSPIRPRKLFSRVSPPRRKAVSSTPVIACLLAPMTLETLASRSKSFAPLCVDEVPSHNDLTKARASSDAPRTEA